MNLPEMNITADGIAGQCGIWKVIRRGRNTKGLLPHRGWNKCWVLYKKTRTGESPQPPWRERLAFIPEYKVQVFNNNSELWKEFDSLKDAEFFIEEIKTSYFLHGKMYDNQSDMRKELCADISWALQRCGPHPRTRDAAKAVMDGFELSFVKQIFELNDTNSVKRLLKRNGYVFDRLAGKGGFRYGRWVKKEDATRLEDMPVIEVTLNKKEVK